MYAITSPFKVYTCETKKPTDGQRKKKAYEEATVRCENAPTPQI
jgi:hypothetical protein